MISLRQGKAKRILENSRNSALTAVEVYNRPNTNFRVENYVILMIIAWTTLFHAYFQSTIGDKYFYKERNGRYKIVDGERKAWELKECIREFPKYSKDYKLSDAVIANLNFFIGIRNKIEHRYWNSLTLDIFLFGECQSLLYNFEKTMVALFGEDYAINTCLAYALQFSQLRAKEQLLSQKELLSKDMQDLKRYVDKYRVDLSQEVYDSQEYSIKLIQIPKISNTNRRELAVEFVNWTNLSDEDKETYEKLTVLIKDKIISQPVYNLSMMKPSGVIKAVKEKIGVKLNHTNHTDLWKAFEVRPPQDSTSKFETKAKYCIYDEPHNDYLYTSEWVDFICLLITNHGFTKDTIREKCKNKLNIDDYLPAPSGKAESKK